MSHQDRPISLVINHQTLKQVIDWGCITNFGIVNLLMLIPA